MTTRIGGVEAKGPGPPAPGRPGGRRCLCSGVRPRAPPAHCRQWEQKGGRASLSAQTPGDAGCVHDVCMRFLFHQHLGLRAATLGFQARFGAFLILLTALCWH